MGLKNQLQDKYKKLAFKKNTYRQLLEESDVPKGLREKMIFFRKLIALYKNK